MKLIEIKIRVNEKCIEKQKEILENAKATMDDAKKVANGYGRPKDRYDSFRDQLLRERDLFAQQYEKSLQEMAYLQKLNPQKSK